jgi:hypothetical protein
MQAEVRIANMLLVVDQSSPMNDKPSPDSTQSRWEIIKGALMSTLTSTQLRRNIDFGLELYPYESAGIDPKTANPTTACQLPTGASAIGSEIDAGVDSLDYIIQILNQQAPGGFSPAAKALNEAYQYYIAGTGKDLKGSKSVLLVTSGESDCNAALSCAANACVPNIENNCPPGDWSVNCCANAGYLCSDDQAVMNAINNLASAGIKTFVVGLPVTEIEAEHLNQFAKAGLAPNPAGSKGESYYSVTSAQPLSDLEAALEPLMTQLVRTCDIPLTATGPFDTNSIRVVKDCMFIPLATSSNSSQFDAGQADGWLIDYSQNPPHLRLVGTYCYQTMIAGAFSLDVLIGCPDAG